MALSFTTTANSPVGNFRLATSLVSLDNSYPTGGYALPASTWGFSQIVAVFVRASAEFSQNRLVRWNRATNTLQVYTALGTEAAGASDQFTFFAAVTVLGR